MDASTTDATESAMDATESNLTPDATVSADLTPDATVSADLTPKEFVKSLKGKDLRYHVLTTLKRVYLLGDRELPINRSDLPSLPPRRSDDRRRDYPEDEAALDKAWQIIRTKSENDDVDDFLRVTVNLLRYKLRGTGYLRNQSGFHIPYPYHLRWAWDITQQEICEEKSDWMDHESQIDEDEPLCQDDEGNDLWRLANGDLVYYDYGNQPVVVHEGQKREDFDMRVDFDDSSDGSDSSDDPDCGLIPNEVIPDEAKNLTKEMEPEDEDWEPFWGDDF